MAVALSDLQTVCGKIDPASQAAGTYNLSTWVDMKQFDRIQIVLSVGALGASATLDAVVKQATSNSGTGSKNLTTSKAITQLTQAGSGSNKVVVINVRGSDLDTANGFEFISLAVTIGTAASVFGYVVLGDSEGTPPSSTYGSITTQVIQ